MLHRFLTFVFACLIMASSVACIIHPGAHGVYHIADVLYGRKDGMALTMDVFQPRRAVPGPALIYVISGGFTSSPEMLRVNTPVCEKLARDHQITVFAVLLGARSRYRIPEMVGDLSQAVHYIDQHASQYRVNPSQIVMLGFSSGGCLALLGSNLISDASESSTLSTRPQELAIKAVAAFYPLTDFMNYGEQGRHAFGTGPLNEFRTAFFDYAVPKPGEEQAILGDSPVWHVNAQTPPTLLIHGDADTLVPLQQSRQYHQAMRAVQRSCALWIKKGGGHGWPDIATDLNAAVGWLLGQLAEKPNVPPSTLEVED